MSPKCQPEPMSAAAFLDSGLYEGDSDFSCADACEFAEAYLKYRYDLWATETNKKFDELLKHTPQQQA